MNDRLRQSRHATRRTRVTINDVADALGLSKSTVSRALNAYPDISESTRLRITRQAARMGYRPLAQAQAIRTGRCRAIGLVIQTDVQDAQRPFLADFLEGVTRAASSEGWTLTVATSAGGAEMLQTLERLIDERKADGFILPRTLADDPRMKLLRGAGIPFVLYGRVADPKDCAWFDILGEEAMRAAAARLADRGHQRIAFVNAGHVYNFALLRESGFRQGMAGAGLAVDDALLVSDVMDTGAGCAATLGLMTHVAPPTAIVFAVDIAALGAYVAADRLGLAIGRDFSVISYDGIPAGRWARPPLTSFCVDNRHAGGRLAHLLIRRIRGEPPESLRETTTATLFEGGSDGPRILSSADIADRVRSARSQNKFMPNGR